MTWYDSNKIAEWKVMIGQPYKIQELLKNWEVVVKDIAGQVDLQTWINTHKYQVVQDCLRLSLQHPSPADSYERKHLWPTRAIDLMTNQRYFSHIVWDTPLLKTYLHLLFRYFLSTIQPHIQNVNIYHGYFHRLFGMLLTLHCIDRNQMIAAIENEQTNHKIVQHLLEHTDKQIVCQVVQLLLVEQLAVLSLSLEFKKNILVGSIAIVQQLINKKEQIGERRIQNIINIIKIFVIKVNDFIKDMYIITEPHFQQRISDYTHLYSYLQSKITIFVNILLHSSSIHLKMAALDLLKYYETFQLITAQRNLIPIENRYTNIQTLTQYFSICEVSIISPIFIDFFKTLLSTNNYQPIIDIIIKYNIIKDMFQKLINNSTKNIYCCAVFQFVKVIIIIMENQISIGRIKNQNKFKFGCHFMDNLRLLANNFCTLISKNDSLFALYYKIFKIVHNYSKNVIQTYGSNQTIPAYIALVSDCSKWIQFYKNCFPLYEKQIYQDLGRYLIPQPPIINKQLDITITFSNKPKKIIDKFQQLSIETQPIIISNAQQIQKIMKNQMNMSQYIHQKSTANNYQQNLTSTKQIKNQDQIKLPTPQIRSENHILDILSTNNAEQLDQSYEIYMKRKLNQTEKMFNQRKSKLKTPNKMKGQSKKTRSKWGDNTNNSLQQKQSSKSLDKNQNKSINQIFSPKISKNLMQQHLEKISIIRISSCKKQKIYKQREINQNDDKRLLSWLKLAKFLR